MPVSRMKRALLASAGWGLCAAAVQAQPAPPVVEEVIVTGSRVARSGFETPTPVTVIGSDQLEQLAVTDIADALNQLPSFRGVDTGENAGNRGPSAAMGVTAVDLRGLGQQRTLVLVNGRRFVPANAIGAMDISVIPVGLISRADVVTGGASAAYGSDAVSGVVNIVLDNDLVGLKGQVDYGTSGENDGARYHVSLAGGTRLWGDRGHLVGGFEFKHDEPIGTCFTRNWCDTGFNMPLPRVLVPAGFPLPGITIAPTQAVNVVTPSGVFFNGVSRGGVLFQQSPAGGVLPNALGTFDRNGVLVPFSRGVAAGLFQLGGGPDAINWLEVFHGLRSEQDIYSTFARFDYDLTESVNLFTEASWARNKTVWISSPGAFRIGGIGGAGTASTTPLRIYEDNAFLRPEAAALISGFAPVNNVTFDPAVGRKYAALGKFINNSQDIVSNRSRVVPTAEITRLAVGLQGSFGDDWSWDGYYQWGRTERETEAVDVSHVANLNRAVDAVVGPNGQIVCRSTLTNPSNGCVPLNVIGEGRMSQAALDYIFPRGPILNEVFEQEVFAANLRASVFRTWAGPIAMAVGYEHREESLSFDYDTPPLVFAVGGGNDASGKVKVDEAYAEVAIPLLADSSIGKSAELNLAGRRTHYSTAGWVNTWKVGLTYQPNDWLRLRGTRSRDIRAPNLFELFEPRSAPNPLRDVPNPRKAGVFQRGNEVRGGNPDLEPETGDTLTLGVVFDPKWEPLDGLRVSIDYYDIDMKKVIATPVFDLQVANFCIQGVQAFCDLISYDANNDITAIFVTPANINQLKLSGVDIEAQYTRFIEPLHGDVTLRVYATWVDEFLQNQFGVVTDYAGQVGQTRAQGGAGFGVPRWIVNTSLSYERGPFTGFVQVRWNKGGVNDATAVGPDGDCGIISGAACTPQTLNKVPGKTYVSVGAAYKILDAREDGKSVEVFGNINNLFDVDPPFNPGSFWTNPIYYDMIGRYFTVGVRFRR